MSHSCTDPNSSNPDQAGIPGTPSIGVVVVIYNKNCLESVSFSKIMADRAARVILVDNSTDPDMQSGNSKECLRLGCEYCSMGGNKGLAAAYNAAAGRIGSRIDYLMILDDDTVIPQDVISVLQQSIAMHPSASVFVPYVFDQAALLSPSRRWSSLFFRLKKRPEAFTRMMSAINSGLVIRLDPENRAKPLFDDKMFLDCIDHDFILRRIRQGDSIELYPAEFRQNFFDRAAQKQAALIRFGIFAGDYLYFCRDCSLSMVIAHMYLIYRMTRLNIRFRTTDFGSALKSSKTIHGKA
ncbi:MAG: glycosyltransferase [Eubacteriales bacterium]